MLKKTTIIILATMLLTSCTITETINFNEDGSGHISLEADLSRMMMVTGAFSQDSTLVKTDTSVLIKDIIMENKTDMTELSSTEQERIKEMENYRVAINIDPEESIMLLTTFTDFLDISEANSISSGFEYISSVLPKDSEEKLKGAKEQESELIGVKYSFNNSMFIRDSYVKNQEAHTIKANELEQNAIMKGGINFQLKYTFAHRIKSTSFEDASFSLDGKTITIEQNLIDYFINPDILDLTIELEK